MILCVKKRTTGEKQIMEKYLQETNYEYKNVDRPSGKNNLPFRLRS